MATASRAVRSAHKLFVARLRWTVDADCLQRYFQKFGTVVHSKVMFDVKTGHSRRFGFVIMSDKAAMDRVLAESTHRLEGQPFTVKPWEKDSLKGVKGDSSPEVDMPANVTPADLEGPDGTTPQGTEDSTTHDKLSSSAETVEGPLDKDTSV